MTAGIGPGSSAGHRASTMTQCNGIDDISRTGVLLFNLGGPETLEDVRPFLFNLFSDPDIIRINNSILRRSIAWLISTTRQGKSRDLYRQIGGGSPLRRITEA